MDNELIKLAQSNIREAMIAEFAKNREMIGRHIMNRRTPRHIKEMVFYAMARNNAITYFLSLENPSPSNLYPPFPTDQEYLKLMQRVGATRYPFGIRYRAERTFFEDYTHLDYKRKRHFLDAPLPNKPKIYQWLEYVGDVVVFIFTYWWVIAIGLVVLMYLGNRNDSVHYSGNSSTQHNTFNQGGITDSNYSPSWSSDSVQIPDTSGQTGFGNSGMTGYDAVDESETDQSPSSDEEINNEQEEAAPVADIAAVSDQQEQTSNNSRILADSLLSDSNQESFHVDKGRLTLGSTKEQVAKVLGNPDSASDSSYTYGFSQINFENNKIVGWFTIDRPLEISLGEKKDDAPPFTVGSSKKEVVDAMGTPSSLFNDAFEYQFSRINFDSDNKVSGWTTIDEPLNVEIKSNIADAHPFAIGSTLEEVVAIMGTPDSYSDDRIGYQFSVVFIQDGKVSQYSDISHNLITIE
ncbi:hypothetical protein L2089_03210 [Paenibacillus hunanensis]|uniref:hypothetical protein n=1 Tax=Paenibacillus hunanensis TaxID=539262 RepID=UPI002026F2E7|nr:hypothetical protein [Paenibacillus hunanensis]MCL9659677.1 hypothetical protein [Paenibacillus hunanensis]